MAFFSLYIRLFFLLTPFFVLSVFLAWTESDDPPARQRLARRVTLSVWTGALLLYFFGNGIFQVLGITIDAFRVGAGALLFLSAVSLVRGDADHPNRPRGDIAIVPLTIPVTLGPAVIGTLMVMSAEGAKATSRGAAYWSHMALETLCLTAAVATVGCMLALSGTLERWIGQHRILIVSKLTGLVLSAMSAQMVLTGVRAFLTQPL